MEGERNISGVRQYTELFGTDLRRLSLERRTIWLAAIQLLPVVGSILLVNWGSSDGLHTYTQLLEGAVFPLLLPIVAIFYGGPVIVDEIERKTLTYLTLRPIPKPVVYLAKTGAGAALATAMITGSILLLYLFCIVLGGGFGASGVPLLRTVIAGGLGTLAYVSIFAALGALFARGMVASVIYYLIFDLVMGQIPVLKVATVRFHLYNIGDFERQGSEILDSLFAGGGWSIPWWGSAAGVGVVTLAAAVGGAVIFTRRQYRL